MQITIIALGTRGDVQPCLALGRGLLARGHDVRVMAGSNFEAWVRGYGFDFTPMADMETIMASEGGADWQRSQGWGQVRAIRRLMKAHQEEMVAPFHHGLNENDVVLASSVATPYALAPLEGTRVPLIPVLLQPFAQTEYPDGHMAASFPFRTPLNRLAIHLSNYVLYQLNRPYIAEQRRKLGLPRQNAREYFDHVLNLTAIQGFSPQVVPPTPDTSPNIHTVGYLFLDEREDYTPPPELDEFLAAGQPPVYIGFGSMADPDPARTLRLICEAVQSVGADVRILLSAGWSAWSNDILPNNVLLIRGAPHDWLFPRVSAVVHHGGAGTTAAGLRAGRPTFIIPHIADQPYWGRRVHKLGVGVRPVARQKLTAALLADGIRQLVNDTAMRDRAAALGERIRGEDGMGNAVRIVEDAVG